MPTIATGLAESCSQTFCKRC